VKNGKLERAQAVWLCNCVICGRDYPARRLSSTTCGGNCRQRKRRGEPQLTPIPPLFMGVTSDPAGNEPGHDQSLWPDLHDPASLVV
jgi:hypothetical protein